MVILSAILKKTQINTSKRLLIQKDSKKISPHNCEGFTFNYYLLRYYHHSFLNVAVFCENP